MFLSCDTIYHFIGIGGASMSQIAKYLIAKGIKVSGSDNVFSKNISDLAEENVNVYLGVNVGVVKSADVVIYTSSIPDSNEELICARNDGKILYERAEFLGELAQDFKKTIAVSGAHGKTTTTGILANIMKENSCKFFSHIGGRSKNFENGFYYSGDDFLLTEACEYKRHFLSLSPYILTILNIDYEHPDTYNSIDDMYDAFSNFANNVQNNGFIVLFDEIDYSKMHICENVHKITFGLKHSSTCYADNIYVENNMCEYDVMYNSEYLMHIKSNLLGIHNIYNTLSCIAVAKILNIDNEIIKNGVENFKGINRRFELAGEINGAQVIIDYAHHPTEISSVIAVAQHIAKGRVFVYFQPHTYSRTSAFLDGFCKSLKDADFVGILKEFSARENATQGKSAFDLFYKFNSEIGDAKYFSDTLDVARDIILNARCGDVILLLGAGDIDKVCKLLEN